MIIHEWINVIEPTSIVVFRGWAGFNNSNTNRFSTLAENSYYFIFTLSDIEKAEGGLAP